MRTGVARIATSGLIANAKKYNETSIIPAKIAKPTYLRVLIDYLTYRAYLSIIWFRSSVVNNKLLRALTG